MGLIIDIRRHRAITRGWKAPMPCTWRFLKDWCADLADWKEYRIQKAVAYLIAIGVHKVSHEESEMLLFIIGTRRERRASQDAEPVGKNYPVKDNVEVAKTAQAHMYEEAAPLRRAGQGESTSSACPDMTMVNDPEFALVCPHGYETWATCEKCEAEKVVQEDYGAAHAPA